MLSEREKTACHEAGHALVAWWFGRPIKRVSIKRDQCTWGRTEFGGDLRTEDYLVLLCAGMVAECLCQGKLPTINNLVDTQDLEILEESAKSPKLSNTEWENLLKQWTLDATEIILTEDYLLGLKAIAKTLFERETIFGDDVLRIMGFSPNHQV